MLAKEDFKDKEGNQIEENTFYRKNLSDEVFYMQNFEIDKSQVKGTQAYWRALDQYGFSEDFISSKETEWFTKMKDLDWELKCLDSRIKKLQDSKNLIQKHKQ